MTFDETLARVLAVLQREGRMSYCALRRRFDLAEEYFEDLKAEIIQAKKLAVDEDGAVLVWTGNTAPASVPTLPQEHVPLAYTPRHLIACHGLLPFPSQLTPGGTYPPSNMIAPSLKKYGKPMALCALLVYSSCRDLDRTVSCRVTFQTPICTCAGE